MEKLTGVCSMANKNTFFDDTERFESKLDIPTSLELACDIAAFANTKGGTIFIGFDPSEEGLRYSKGLSDIQVQEVIKEAEEAIRLLHPEPRVSIIEDIALGFIQFVVVSVEKYSPPVLLKDKRYFVRRGDKTTLAEEVKWPMLSRQKNQRN